MKRESDFTEKVVKRVITMLISICILLGEIVGCGDVILAAEYDSDETVIEAGKLNKNGTTIINGQIVESEMQTDMHDGIIRMLDDETEIVDSLIYGNREYSNEHSIFSDANILINAETVYLGNIIVAEGDITINASTMYSDEYTIIYSKNGNIQFNLGQMDFNGIIYAPKGKVDFSASHVNIKGKVMADEVNIYVGVFEIDGVEEYSNIVDRLEFLKSNTLLEISSNINTENCTYSIDIVSGNENVFEKMEVYIRYDNEDEFSYLCEL